MVDNKSHPEDDTFEEELLGMYREMKANAALSEPLMERLRADYPSPQPSLWKHLEKVIIALGAAPALAALVLFLWVSGPSAPRPVGLLPEQKTQPLSPGWISKSSTPEIQVLMTRPSVRPLMKQEVVEGMVLQEDDELQFVIVAPVALHLMVLSVNEKGAVARYLPASSRSFLVHKGRSVRPQGEALILDGFLGRERLFVFAARRPFAATAVEQALKRAWKAEGQKLMALHPTLDSCRLVWSMSFIKRPIKR